MFNLSEKSKARLEGVNPQLVKLALRAIQITKIDFGIPEDGGIRTPQRQNDLFQSGKSNADGYHRRSYHQTGKALDFYAYVDGKASWEKEHLAQVACAFLQAANELSIPVRWGGLFKSFTDMPHIELIQRG